MDKTQKIQQLQEELKNCSKCSLIKNTIQPVGLYTKNINSPVMVIAEAPGQEEENYLVPLIGKSGELLNTTLEKLKVSRNEIITSNIVLCRPKDNRTPTEEECQKCAPHWLEKQIEILEPKIIIALGATAAKYLSGNQDIKITKDRGKVFKHKKIPFIPTLHPSYVLRKGGINSKEYQLFLKDIDKAITLAKEEDINWEPNKPQPNLKEENKKNYKIIQQLKQIK